jgi:hypothetical protein
MHKLPAILLLAATTAIACGGGGSPSAPAGPSASSVIVTLPSTLVVGTNQQASAAAALSNGSSQAVTTGWRSDNPAVATVTDTGLVTPVANGSATIFVVFSGVQGQQVVRVVPNFQGQWRGSYIVLNCTQTGIYATINFCDGKANTVLPTTLTLTQTGTAVSGNFFTGTLAYTSISAPIEADGTIVFSGTTTTPSTIQITVSWRLASPENGKVTGVHTQVWRSTEASGEMRMDTRIVDWLNRIAGLTAPPSAARPMRNVRDVMEALRQP